MRKPSPPRNPKLTTSASESKLHAKFRCLFQSSSPHARPANQYNREADGLRRVVKIISPAQ